MLLLLILIRKIIPKEELALYLYLKRQKILIHGRLNNFSVKDKDNLVVYELLVRDFTDTGDLNGVMSKLDYLKSLGINAIELMPVQEFDGNDQLGL